MKKNWITEPILSEFYRVDTKKFTSLDGTKLMRSRKQNPFALFDMISGKRTSTTNTTAQQRKIKSSPNK
jgi:hypothetical protein